MVETTADVRRDIELTRERMSSTLAELEQKLNLVQIVRDHPWLGGRRCKLAGFAVPNDGAGTGLNSGFLEGVTEVVQDLVVGVGGEYVPGHQDQADGPFDDFQGGQGRDPADVGQLLRRRQGHRPDDRQRDTDRVPCGCLLRRLAAIGTGGDDRGIVQSTHRRILSCA